MPQTRSTLSALNAEELASAESEAYKDLRKEGAIPYWEMEKEAS